MTLPVLADVLRSGFVEGHHRGSVVAVAADGRRLVAVGDVESPMFPRSSLKPVQALAMLRAGLDLDGESLALACSSHNGERFHTDGVQSLLARFGLTVDQLDNTADLPLDAPSAAVHLAAGGQADRLHQNCSGKHAAMLATCVVNGWPVTGYRDPDHPLQRHIREVVEEIGGEPVAHVAVDGCGAPLFAHSLAALARCFGVLVTSDPGTPERRVADAMRAHPYAVGGAGRDVTTFMQRIPGLLAKDGAEAVYAAALADGTAVALKVDDGGGRARMPVLTATLRALGVEADWSGLTETPVLGGGAPVGGVVARPVPLLA